MSADRIQPYATNPSYWQYRGKPVLLLGGSVEDNLYQIDNLREHLDLLVSVGGNFVRGTMSCRDEGNVWPFERDDATGKYDLSKPGREHWRRFEEFLKLTHERGIFVQFELWDRFDFAREPWLLNPFNPANNVNYTCEQSGLVERIDTHPGNRESAWFRSVPALDNNELLLKYQHAYVDKMLSISLKYDHCLYCMDNETNESPEWGRYWANYIRQKAAEAGAEVETTEMWDPHDLNHAMHAATFESEDYSFVDISQNNHQQGQKHYDNMRAARQRVLAYKPRPVNTVKIYGANTGRFGTNRDAQERFWRNIFGGLAGTRFHRPPSGIGLSELAQRHIRSGRMLTDAIDVFTCVPSNELLSDRSANEAYCFANAGVEYAVFFCDGGNVLLDVSAAADKRLTVRWLDILASQWLPAKPAKVEDGKCRLVTPRDSGFWAALVN